MDVLQHFTISHFAGFISDFRSLFELCEKKFNMSELDKEYLFRCIKEDLIHPRQNSGKFRTEIFLEFLSSAMKLEKGKLYPVYSQSGCWTSIVLQGYIDTLKQSQPATEVNHKKKSETKFRDHKPQKK